MFASGPTVEIGSWLEQRSDTVRKIRSYLLEEPNGRVGARLVS